MLEQDASQLAWEHYTADVLGALLNNLCSLGGGKSTLPLYSELAQEKDQQSAAQNKAMAKQVIQNIVNRL